MSKVLKFIILILLCLSLTACGDLATQSEIEAYARGRFGKAQCIDYNMIRDEKVVAVLQDKAYKFNYTITSYLRDIYIDGTYFGSSEHKESDFYDKYVNNMISSKVKEFAELGCEIAWCTDAYKDCILADIYFSNKSEDEIQKTVDKLAKTVKKYDKRKALINTVLLVYNNDERIGEYSFSKGKYMSVDEAEYEFFRRSLVTNLKVYLDVDIKNEKQIEFMYLETLTLDEIKEKYGDFKDARCITDKEEDFESIEVYHFKVKDDEYIIADCLDSNTNGNYLTRKIK